jgi:asparagine synthase (glutamine-hydrolysing)
MSVLGGVLNFNSKPVEKEFLVSMGQALAARGPDGGGQYCSGSVGMVYRAFHTTEQSWAETQPLVSALGHLLCWDGRLDNREDLISVLRDDLHEDRTDLAIVMAAYLRWGLDFLPRLLGDFALSLWNSQDKSLLLARDPIGPRTLYYHLNDKRILWSTDLEALITLGEIDLAINDEYIADTLTSFPQLGQTPYKDVHGVKPAHAVIVRHRAIHVKRFWTLDPQNRIHYKTDAEYEEHFRHLFREAVRCRMRAAGAVWAELSGGLDSSSVVCMAHDLIRSGDVRVSGLETVSRVYDEENKSDEREYIQHVERRIGKRGVYLREDDHRFMSPLAANYSRTFPNMVADFVAEYFRGVDEVMEGSGARVLLSGEAGDEVASSIKDPAPMLTDLLVAGKLIALHKSLVVWCGGVNRRYFRVLLNKAVFNAIPSLREWRMRNAPEIRALNRTFDAVFLKRMDLDGRRFRNRDVYGFLDYCGQEQAATFGRSVRLISAGYHRELTNVEFRYPFTHRPLVEFLHAIPFDQRVRPRQTRSIVRRALTGLLPPEILARKDKGLAGPAYKLAARREWQRLESLFAEPRVCAHRYVNHNALREVVTAAKEGTDRAGSYLAFILPIEYWLRAFETRIDGAQVSIANDASRATTRTA